MREFDQMMNRLEITKSSTLKREVKQIIEDEALAEQTKLKKRKVTFINKSVCLITSCHSD